METPLQFLRDLFPFSRPPASATGVAEVREWLDSTADEPSMQAIRTLASQIVPGIGRQGSLHMRFKLLEEAMIEVERALPPVERQVEDAILPLPMAVATAALTADNLLKVVAIAYSGIAHSIQQQKLNAGLTHLLESSIRRAIQAISRRQRLAYRAYASPSAASWQMLHDLYRIARHQGINSRNGGEPPVDHLYAGALLLAFVAPNKFPRGTLDQIRACAERLAPLAIVAEATPENCATKSAIGQFVVPADEGSPGRPLVRASATATLLGSLVIDYRPALAVLDRQLRRHPEEPQTLPLDAPETVLRALRVAIGGHAARRFARTRFKPRADLIAGIDQVIEFLNGRALNRRVSDGPRPAPRRPLEISEWALLDESPEGFGIRFVKGERIRIQAGEIVGLQPRENSQLHLCLVRRIATTPQQRLELGLQELAPLGLAIDLPGGDPGQPRQAILLPHLPGHGNCAGVLARPGDLKSNQRINFRDPERSVRFRVGELLEANPQLELFALTRIAG